MKLVKLTPELLRELQLKQLDMLVYFRDFCERNNLTFYLIGGTLIGAVRSGGFVPWDDDIDVMLPRPDYERLTKLWKEQESNERFELLRSDDKIFTGDIFTTLVDKKYTLIKASQLRLDVPHGLVMDIFPLDAAPDNNIKRKKQLFWTLIYSLFSAQVVPEKHGGITALGSRVLLDVFSNKNVRRRIWKYAEKQISKYNFKDNKYVTELCSGPKWMIPKYPKDIYNGVTYVNFEGERMPCMSGYDEYLTMIFGDYMKLPPKSEQKPHHEIAYLDLNRPAPSKLRLRSAKKTVKGKKT